MERLSAFQPYALAALRIIAALLFIEHGTMKLFAFPAAQMEGPLPPLLLAAALIEVVGGLLVLIGLFTRPVAFILSGQMAVAYFMAHGSKAFWPALNGGEAAILFCFIFLFIFFAGPGALSVDQRKAAA
ncbi:DoxX family protein [Rhizobium grahamii]|uniref:DoxX family protein n=1 Tax=Rhizobium grahamii CCGE 502 TaxID=990285 RepID=S3HJ44_9HYPH|nr:DoxX family protein [Rhizobium grahamii]EPE98055.1 DoxX family protein [Rhizobium grahamii CCGE 502]